MKLDAARALGPRRGKTVSAVCHAPGVLRRVHTKDGELLVKGRQVTGVANTEEAAAQLTQPAARAVLASVRAR